MFKLLGSVIVIISICFTTNYGHASQANTLDCYIHHILKTDNIPGMSAAIVVDGQVAWSKGYGYANMETKQPMSADTPFCEIASVTKVITATALMIAQEQGYLSLDDDINDILITALFEVDRPQESEANQPITFRQLASHTSGIVDSDAYACAYFVGDAFGEHQKLINLPEYASFGYQCPVDSPVDLEGFLASYLNKEGLFYNEEENFTDFAPGKRFQYSNIATGLEGYLIGLATGVPLDQYAMWTIFKPLDMHHTSWNYSDMDPDKIAVPYLYNEENQKLAPLPLYSLATWPDGGLKTSANDLGRFLGAIMNFGTLNGTTILSKESVSEMIDLKNYQLADGEWEMQVGIHWIGFNIEGRRVIGHNGEDPGIISYLFFDPDKKIGVVLLINRDEPDQPIYNLLGLLFEKAEKVKAHRKNKCKCSRGTHH